jgi:predicted DNA-binding protein YlxM (UPF0122 family)
VKNGGAKNRKKWKSDKLKGSEILQFTIEGKFLREYSSMIEAEKDLGIDHEAIYRCLDGLQKTAGDFQWRYKIDPNFDEGIFVIPPVINWRTIRLQTVVQYTLKGKFVKEYSCVKEAAEICGISEISIMRSVRRLQQSAKKYQWRFKKDVIKDGKILDIEPVKKQLGLAVCKFDMDGKFIREYPSMSEAARDECVSKAAISLRLKRKKCGDYQWRFKVEVVKKKKDRKKIFIKPVRTAPLHYFRAVCQFKQDGKSVREYPSIYEASEKTDTTRSLIFLWASKKMKNRDGYLWRFKEDVVDKDGKISDIDTSKRRKKKKE